MRLAVCPRMRHPESLRSLTCHVWGFAPKVVGIENGSRPAAPSTEVDMRVCPLTGEIAISRICAADDAICSVFLCASSRNTRTMCERPEIARTEKATGLRSPTPLDVNRIRCKEHLSLNSSARRPSRSVDTDELGAVGASFRAATSLSIAPINGAVSRCRK